MALLLSTAYAPPVQYFAHLLGAQGQVVYIEASESYLKQTYRNRCHILTAQGEQALTIPVEHSGGVPIPIREVRLSEHGNWRHRHAQAIVTAYGASPYFEYYWDDLRPIWERPHTHLWDMNQELTDTLARLVGLEVCWRETTDFLPPSDTPEVSDCRYGIRPKHPCLDVCFAPQPYYQPYADRLGFVPNLSMLDLLFNMGPESLLVLQRSFVTTPHPPCL